MDMLMASSCHVLPPFLNGVRRIIIGRRSMPSRSASSGAPSQWGVAAGEGRRPTTGRMSRSLRSASSRINLGPYSFC
ncbi:hypothetical protein ACQJBY_005777 [Aegilops geniculata]